MISWWKQRLKGEKTYGSWRTQTKTWGEKLKEQKSAWQHTPTQCLGAALPLSKRAHYQKDNNSDILQKELGNLTTGNDNKNWTCRTKQPWPLQLQPRMGQGEQTAAATKTSALKPITPKRLVVCRSNHTGCRSRSPLRRSLQRMEARWICLLRTPAPGPYPCRRNNQKQTGFNALTGNT